MGKISGLICPNCGYSVFFPIKANTEYECIKCKEKIKYNGDKKGFFSATDNEALKTIARLGFDLAEKALESDAVQGGITLVCTSYLAANIVTGGAIGFLIGSIPGILKAITEKKLFSEKTIQQEFEKLFKKRLNKTLIKGKNREKGLKYYQYRLFFDRCRHFSDIILNKLQKNGYSEDIFKEETIEYIYDNFYAENTQAEELNNIKDVSKEILQEYKNDIFNDPKLKEAYLEIQNKNKVTEKLEYLAGKASWIEEIAKENSKKIDECLTRIKSLSIKADNNDYLLAYSKKLFFEDENSDITLGSIYIDPSVKDSGKKASEIINEWYENDEEHTTLLILGSAGIGKTSLCSKIIADSTDIVNENSRLFRIPFDKIHVKALRKCVANLKDYKTYTIDDLIERIFAPSGLAIDYDNKLFILDGLDELGVLCKDFSVKIFIEKLKKISSKSYKILITSRESENCHIAYDSHIKVETLIWNENDMNIWCEKYSELKVGIDAFYWCDKFRDFYGNLDANDKRREVFLVPVLLYIAAHTNIDFSSNSSVCQIYDEAFRCLLERRHIESSTGNEAFVDSLEEKMRKKMYWQYTKELAFQMALSRRLSLSSKDGDIHCIENAQKRTKIIIDKDGAELGENYDFDIDNSDYLSVFQFAKSDENGQSIEFVHKTVYEYFAAVKLFEDYFKKLTIQTSIEDAWKLIIKAFGQCDFEFDIIKHLAELMKGLDLDIINHFYTTFANGMLKNELFIQFINVYDDTDEYDNIGIALMPIKMIFGCLIMMLSFMGYKNSQYSRLADKGWGSATQKTFDFFFRNLLPVCLDSYYDFSEWNFEDADLSGMDIRHISFNKAILNKANLNATTINNYDLEDEKIGFNNAHMIGCKMKGINYKFVTFENANLEGSSLNGSYVYDSSFVNAILFKANLSGSRIECSSFKGADLKDASLRGVVLDGVDFENADLRGADLRGVFFLNLQGKTRFNGAKYNNDRKSNSNITFFPDGFDPKERGMILDNTSY